MHVLLITHHYEPEIGAPQRRWSALIKRWTAEGHSVTVFCPPPHYPNYASTSGLRAKANAPFKRQTGQYGETIVRVPYLLHGHSTISRLVDQLLSAGATAALTIGANFPTRLTGKFTGKRVKYDAVISTVPGLPSIFAGLAVSKALGIPHMAELRDAWPDVVTGDLSGQVGKLEFKRALIKRSTYELVTLAQKSADALVVTSPWFMRKLRQRGLKNVLLMPNGADAADFADISALEPGFQDQRACPELRVQYVGTVGRSQGLMVLIKALEILKFRLPELPLKTRIIGSGSELPLLKAEAERAGLDIEFFDPIPREELGQAYEWADIEIVSLRKTKPFRGTIPSKIFELLATRRYLLALVEGDAADIVHRSGAGSVVEPEDASALADELERLASHPEILAVGEKGAKLVTEEFNYERLSESYLWAMESLIEGRSVKRASMNYLRKHS